MRRLLLYISCICLALLSFLQVRAERIDTLLHFNLSDLRIETVPAPDGQTYTKLFYPGCEEGFHLGAPTLPVKLTRITLPENAENISCTLKTGNTSQHAIGNVVFPRQFPETFSNSGKRFIPCDRSIYDVPAAYPEEQVVLTGITRLHDNSKYVDMAIYPATYYPVERKIEFSEHITVMISYSLLPKKSISQKASSNPSLQSIGLPIYEYCIITTRALKDSFNRLIAWKRQKGLDAGVVCVEDIIDNPYITQDNVSSSSYTPIRMLTDSAAQIRQYLRLAYNESNHNLKYVLMGGDASIVPIRYGSGHPNSGADDSLEDNIPTDLYYSEFGADWNKDNDKYLGEPGNTTTSEVNYFGSIMVGRILCTTSNEVENYTNKLLWYEMNPGNGNYSYLQNALYVQADQGQDDGMGDNTALDMASVFPNYSIIEESPTYNSNQPTSPTGSEVITAMNEPVGFVNFYAHGNPYEIFVRTMNVNENLHADGSDSVYFHAVTSEQGLRTVSSFDSNNGLDKLTNQHCPMIGFSASCYNAPFDIIQDVVCHNNVVFDSPSLGKSFTIGNGYGGPAWFGNTREGIIKNTVSFQTQLNAQIKNHETLGKALSYARSNVISTEKHYTALSSNLIGCPEILVWTQVPSFFQQSLVNEDYWSVSNSTYNGYAHIGFRAINEPVESPDGLTVEDITDPTQEFDIVPRNDIEIVTLYGDNLKPRILPLHIEDGDMEGSHYVFVKDATIGGESNGQCVTFINGSDYTFEKSGTFRMPKNVVIERGAKLVIKNSSINY